VVLRVTTPFEASLIIVKRAGEAASIREHPKRTSTMKHIVDSALVVSIILVDRRWQGLSLNLKDRSDLRWRGRLKRPRDLSGELKEDPEDY
jgi:hypothetical protein